MTQQLIGAQEALEWVKDGQVRVFDCRFDLQHRKRGRDSWLASHIPGAAYADLDQNLAGRVTVNSGRHPLPNRRHFAGFLAQAGWVPGVPMLAYDAQGGAFAARLWWLMKYFGHDCVALLDGGFSAWRAVGGPLESGEVIYDKQPLAELTPDPAMVLDAATVARELPEQRMVLLDARDSGRFAGENETIDPVAGHIPGAINRPFQGNLNEQGKFLDERQLAARFAPLIPADNPADIVHMCGSGVTGCHNLFAMEQAGLTGSRLYVGSWSEWIRDPARPVAMGAES
jgi:thiosulfate/3-mercaptopyruvate sulfurtransferase